MIKEKKHTQQQHTLTQQQRNRDQSERTATVFILMKGIWISLWNPDLGLLLIFRLDWVVKCLAWEVLWVSCRLKLSPSGPLLCSLPDHTASLPLPAKHGLAHHPGNTLQRLGGELGGLGQPQDGTRFHSQPKHSLSIFSWISSPLLTSLTLLVTLGS